MTDGAIEIITGRERHRRWSVEDKLRMVAETHEPGASIQQVAARHDLYPSLLFTWRRQAREGKLALRQMPMFVPVHRLGAVVPAVLPEAGRSDQPVLPAAAGRIEIELKDGSRVRVDGGVSLASLRRVLAALRG